ncbi:cytochrome P450 [Promicromonospora sukumoe]|uniref:cytochrome P450 n=1 Tax=Promicromonospora sukumoe TaxID=88382 RepID=UPI00364F9904
MPAPVDLGPAEATRVVTRVLAPLAAQGAIVRRPRMTAWAERHQTDRTARAVLMRLRARHHGAPLALRLGTRRLVVVTEPDDVRRVLDGTPEPFTPATKEKRAALAHFQPEGLLISSAADRARRRPFNEAVLQADQPVHGDAEPMVRAVERAAATLASAIRGTGRLDATTFADTWWQIVLEVTLGPRARADQELVDALGVLRGDANWSYLHPRRRELCRWLHHRIESYATTAEPGSLVAAAHDRDPDTAPGQVPHWLFAFDAAGAATLRALAVVQARPGERDRVLAGAEAEAGGEGPALLPYGRACVLESLRLWPTTLAVLRDSTRPTTWGGRTLPAGTGFAVVSAFFHRDPERLEHADAWAPEAWLDGRNDADWGLVPFSGGPASCPGRNLVLLVASHLLARLAAQDLRTERGEHLARDPLPATVDHLGLRFRLGAPWA